MGEFSKKVGGVRVWGKSPQPRALWKSLHLVGGWGIPGLLPPGHQMNLWLRQFAAFLSSCLDDKAMRRFQGKRCRPTAPNRMPETRTTALVCALPCHALACGKRLQDPSQGTGAGGVLLAQRGFSWWLFSSVIFPRDLKQKPGKHRQHIPVSFSFTL